MSLEELVRTVLNKTSLSKYFWVDVLSISYYLINRFSIIHILKLTPYEIYKEVKLSISHLHVLGCKYFVLNNIKNNFGKFDAKVDESIFNVYSNSRQSF